MTLAYDVGVARPRPATVARVAAPRSGPNALISALGPVSEALSALMRPTPLSAGETLGEVGETPRFVEFPLSGAVGLRASPQEDGLDAVLIGRDGAVGVAEALAQSPQYAPAVVRQSGAALRMEAARLRDAAERVPELRRVLDAWSARLQDELRRTVVCAASHRLEGRLASWLLRCRERSGAEVLAIRQEELAEALGVQRTSVNAAAQMLQTSGAIRTGRGRIAVPDEAALRRRACACVDRQASPRAV